MVDEFGIAAIDDELWAGEVRLDPWDRLAISSRDVTSSCPEGEKSAPRPAYRLKAADGSRGGMQASQPRAGAPSTRRVTSADAFAGITVIPWSANTRSSRMPLPAPRDARPRWHRPEPEPGEASGECPLDVVDPGRNRSRGSTTRSSSR